MFLSCLLKLKCWSCTFDARKENECLCSFLDKHGGEKSFAKKLVNYPRHKQTMNNVIRQSGQ